MKGPYLLTIALACLAGLTAAQNNYVDEYDFDAPAPSRPNNRPSSFRPAPQQPSAPRPSPVAILKQIDKHNDDGSYTYGYEGADGSFKIETKLVSGEVMGKYGYVDDTGKVRVVEYGANRYGFMPAGEGITVAPPTLVDDTTKKGDRAREEFFDDGSYYPEEPLPPQRPAPRPASRPRPAPRPQPQYNDYVPPPPPPPPPAPRRPAPQSAPAPPRPQIPNASPVFNPAPVYEERPAPQRSHSHPPPPPQFARSQPRYEDLPPVSQPQRPAPQPQPQRFAPPPQPQRFAPPPPPQQQPSRAQHARSSGGILDQLERDYALPQGGGQPTHDISFSSF